MWCCAAGQDVKSRSTVYLSVGCPIMSWVDTQLVLVPRLLAFVLHSTICISLSRSFLRPGKHVLCRLNCIRSTLYYEKKGIIVCICPFSSSSFQTEYNNSPPSEKIKPCWRRHSENSQQQQVSLIWMSMRARFTLFLLYIPLILAACVASPWRALFFGWQWSQTFVDATIYLFHISKYF